MRSKFTICLLIGLCSVFYMKAQSSDQAIQKTKFESRLAIKTNALYDLTSTINLGFEVKANSCVSFDISGNYNNWNTYNNNRFRHYLIQPELRYWFGRPMEKGFFLAGQTLFGEFSVSGNNIFGLKPQDKYEGYLLGLGVGVGYRWKLTKHWHMEAELGYGFSHIEYDRYHTNNPNCQKVTYGKYINRWMPTKAAINFIYEIK